MGSEGIYDKYINPYTDFGFKKLFGTKLNEDLLISFLNALLAGKETIKEITYLNTEHLATQELDRRAVFDVYCMNEKGERFLVEMQKAEQQFFKDRSIYYSTFAIREQAPKGVWDYELKGVYVICILNFTFRDECPDVCRYVQLMDTKTKNVFYDKLTFIYLEMPKFLKTEKELDGMLDKWLFVLRNLSRLMERPKALQERVFTSLFEAAEIARFDRRNLLDYEESLKNYRDWYSVEKTAELKGHAKGLAKGLAEGLAEGHAKGLEEGRAEGHAKGLAEGRAEGERQKNIENARNLKRLGVSDDIIHKVTGLSPEEIADL